MFQKVLYYSGFIFSCYAFVFILWQNQAYKFRRFKFHAFFMLAFHLYLNNLTGLGDPRRKCRYTNYQK